MCGIAGAWTRKPIPQERTIYCQAQMGVRGPDHQARFQINPRLDGKETFLTMLHSRLNIIDPNPRANQPFIYGDLIGAINGELYNYKELREDFLRQSLIETESDTEVFMAMYDAHREDAFDSMEGMWAAALFDKKNNSLTLTRDRFGQKPLYFYQDEYGIYWGSEPKYIFTLLGKKLSVDYEHIRRFLVNGYKALYKQDFPHFFKDLVAFPAGEAYTFPCPDTRTLTWKWRWNTRQDNTLSYEQAVDQARFKLLDTVRRCLRSDFPIAFCLSGGVDSNALVAIAKKVCGYDVHTFHVTQDDPRYTEQDFVDLAVQEYGVRHTDIKFNVSGDTFLSDLRMMVQRRDAPVLTLAYYMHWKLMQAVKEHGYRVITSGTGADELFTGYYDHRLFYIAALPTGGRLQAVLDWEDAMRDRKGQLLVRNPFLQDPYRFVNQPEFRDHIYLHADLFQEILCYSWPRELFTEVHFCDDPLRNRMLNEMFYESVPVILQEDDANAMNFGVENRSPFLDTALFDFCQTIPTRHLIQKGYTKSILRDAVRGLVPEPILNTHRKVGFNMSIEPLLRQPEVMEWLHVDSEIYGVVQKDEVLNLAQRTGLPNSESKFLFSVLSCKMFLEECGG